MHRERVYTINSLLASKSSSALLLLSNKCKKSSQRYATTFMGTTRPIMCWIVYLPINLDCLDVLGDILSKSTHQETACPHLRFVLPQKTIRLGQLQSRHLQVPPSRLKRCGWVAALCIVETTPATSSGVIHHMWRTMHVLFFLTLWLTRM